MSGGDEQCFENPTAPRRDDPTANEMTLSLRLIARGVAPKADLTAAEAAEAQRSYGHFPEEGEQLDTRPGHLLVVCGCWSQPLRAGNASLLMLTLTPAKLGECC